MDLLANMSPLNKKIIQLESRPQEHAAVQISLEQGESGKED